ncbi:MAG: hypothetical protein IT553_01835 [Sphingomonadaceae bacterium]|nr:hypothetical protein [Sphingomonadaceae bacterium]
MVAEQRQLGILTAVVLAHALLLAALSLSWRAMPPRFDNPPIAVEILAETAPVSTSPTPAAEAPAARLGDPDSAAIAPPPPVPEALPVKPDPPRPAPIRPTTRAIERPTPTPRPQAARQPPRTPPATRQAPARPTDRRQAPVTPTTRTNPNARDPRPSGALDGIAAGVARDAARNTRGTSAPAARTGDQVRADIRVSINAEVRAPWNRCVVTGVDVDRLKTSIVFHLTQSGALDRIISVETTGVNASNRPQVARFEECARRAIQLAAPFAGLPAEYYSHWATYTLDFEKR